MNPTGAKHLRIGDLLSTQRIRLNLQASQRDEVLSELVGAIPELEGRPQDQETLLRALQEREQLHSTGIGDQIALPHARNALVGLVAQPVVVFGRHEKGIPYGAIDGRPARLFFLLVAPTVTQHLAVLARVSRLVRDLDLRLALLSVSRPDQALTLIRDAEAKM